jgi:hypothetical protein
MNDSLRAAWDGLVGHWEALQQDGGLWQPVLPAGSWRSSAVAIGSLLALAIIAGVSILAFGVLISALFAAHLILSQVFGISIEVAVR